MLKTVDKEFLTLHYETTQDFPTLKSERGQNVYLFVLFHRLEYVFICVVSLL